MLHLFVEMIRFLDEGRLLDEAMKGSQVSKPAKLAGAYLSWFQARQVGPHDIQTAPEQLGHLSMED